MPFLSSHLNKFCPISGQFFPVLPEKITRAVFQRGVAEGAIVGVAVGTGVMVGSTAGM